MPGPRKPRPAAAERIALQADLWLSVGEATLGGHDRIALLSAIATQGSITHAAKAVGMSYKAAWDAVDAMNTLAGTPLVARNAGGRGGGSTTLTARGAELVQRYAQLQHLHARYVQLLDEASAGLAQDVPLMKLITMKTSARNQFLGTVSGYRAGAVNDEITLRLPGGAEIVAIVTHDSTEQLGLTLGAQAFALVKASSIIVATELDATLRLSARNQLAGTVRAVTPGAVNTEVVIDIGGDASVAAIVTQASAQAMALTPGQPATAIFKASSVILGALR